MTKKKLQKKSRDYSSKASCGPEISPGINAVSDVFFLISALNKLIGNGSPGAYQYQSILHNSSNISHLPNFYIN